MANPALLAQNNVNDDTGDTASDHGFSSSSSTESMEVDVVPFVKTESGKAPLVKNESGLPASKVIESSRGARPIARKRSLVPSKLIGLSLKEEYGRHLAGKTQKLSMIKISSRP
jgi:hypothetical protein